MATSGNAQRKKQQQRQTVPLSARLHGLLQGVKLTFVCLLIASALWLGGETYRYLDKPVQTIAVQGDFTHISQEELAQWVEPLVNGGMVSLNLKMLRQSMQQHPWIADASVSRRWPDGLLITVIEEVPVARWGDAGFLNSRGQALSIESNSHLQALPLMSGPEGQEQLVMERFTQWRDLLASVGLEVSAVELNQRGSWSINLQDAPLLVLGRDDFAGKIERFLVVWEQHLQQQAENVAQVDLRYGNGLAVRWKQLEMTAVLPTGWKVKMNQLVEGSGQPESV